MDYISVKDAAARWGLTAGRINTLANAGRIPGAQRIGRSWIIPANSEKPMDGRYKQHRKTGEQYHFPLFIFYPYKEQGFLQGLSADEKRLLEGQLACEACDFEQALDILQELVNSTQQFSVRIGALYYLCTMASILNLSDLFYRSYTQLRDILATDFPHRDDFQTLLPDIDSFCFGNQVFVENFTLDITRDYSPEGIPYLTIQSIFKDAFSSVVERIPMSTNVASLLCKNYEQSHLYIGAQFLHLYIACAFTGNKQPFINSYHLRRAIDLGIEYNSYRVLAILYISIKQAFDEALKDYDPAISERIVRWSKIFSMNEIAFLGDTASSIKIIAELNVQQLQLMSFAVQGFTNKEIAQFTGIPEYTIRRHYEKLLQKFNVPKKKQLGELFIKAWSDGFK